MRLLMLTAVAVLAAAEAGAVEYHLLQWKKDRQCEVVARPPFFGSHYVELGLYPSKWEAERALDDHRRRRECPPPPEDDRHAAKPRPGG
ncbi:MAG: hypothetical protein AB1918_16705 [Pseudomonadota bacterium]